MEGSLQGPEESTKVMDKPLICIFDMPPEALDLLTDKQFNVTSATLGNPIRVGNEKKGDAKYVKLNYAHPANLHEFDVVVFDLSCEKEIVAHRRHTFGDVSGGAAYVIHSAYPEHVFNPRPGGMKFVGDEINLLLSKMSLVIIFADSIESAEYQTVKISIGGSAWDDRFSGVTTDLYKSFPKCRNKEGRRLKAAADNESFFPLVQKYFGNGHYKIVFDHPTLWNHDRYKDEKDESFIPLIVNEAGEVVSYFHAVDKGCVLVFPPVEDKSSFIVELFEVYLPEHFPDLFPYSTQFAWLDRGGFPVPGELQLLENRKKIDEEYANQVLKNENSIKSLKSEYGFLRDLLSETGDALVVAVELYLKWLGFESVVNQDEHQSEVLEEDLQVDCGDRLLVIEVKGIGGTSTDKACSQITKIKNRRMKQRNSFEVYGLYIVNHERYVAPDKRKNPPFTEHQLQDALLDERGLLTTYQLYLAYFLINDGVLSKEGVREQLFDYGLITLVPTDLKSLGLASEHLMKGMVIVIDLQLHSLSVGDVLIAKKNSIYSKHTVLSIQVDGEDVSVASGGVVGIKVDMKIPTRSEIFLRPSSSIEE